MYLQVVAHGGKLTLLGAATTIAYLVANFYWQSIPNYTISRETTRITKHLTKDGDPDYVAAINARCREGITPDSNAVALLVEALGPQDLSYADQYCGMLGIEPLPSTGDYLVTPRCYLEAQLEEEAKDTLRDQEKEFSEHVEEACRRPWSAEDFPRVADWIATNEKPVALAIQATKRPKCYAPLINFDNMPGVTGVLLPICQYTRPLVQLLAARSMLRLNNGDMNGAWSDILACYRLSRHLGSQAFFVQTLVSYRYGQYANRATQALAQYEDLSVEQLCAIRNDIESLPPPAGLVDKLNQAERFGLLETTIHNIMQGRRTFFQQNFPRTPQDLWTQYRIATAFDWDRILREENKFVDRLSAALDAHTYQLRRDGADAEYVRLEEIARQYPRNPTGSYGGLVSVSDVLSDARHRLLTIVDCQLDRATRTKHAAAVIGYVLLPHVPNDESTRATVEFELTKLTLALAQYRMEHMNYPKELDDAFSAPLWGLPHDEFSQQRFLYARTERGCRLASVGPNGRDDHGNKDDILVELVLGARDNAHRPSERTKPVTSSVPATQMARAMVGRWGSSGEESLRLTLEGDRVVISAPQNDTWRMEIHDAKAVGDSIHFVQKNYLHSGESHPFNGVACNSQIKLIENGKIELKMSTSYSKDLLPEILTRVTGQ